MVPLGKTLERVPLLAAAWDIVQAQPKSEDGRIFPVDPATLSKYFCWSCRALGIVDLTLHDMRHEGTSRLFEAGFSIEKVALVTGHRSWAHLKRYTNLRPEDLTQQDRAQQQRTGGQHEDPHQPRCGCHGSRAGAHAAQPEQCGHGAMEAWHYSRGQRRCRQRSRRRMAVHPAQP